MSTMEQTITKINRATLHLSIGRLLCSHLRNYCDQLKFSGYDLEYIEGTGMLSREWMISGEPAAIDGIKRWVERRNQT